MEVIRGFVEKMLLFVQAYFSFKASFAQLVRKLFIYLSSFAYVVDLCKVGLPNVLAF